MNLTQVSMIDHTTTSKLDVVSQQSIAKTLLNAVLLLLLTLLAFGISGLFSAAYAAELTHPQPATSDFQQPVYDLALIKTLANGQASVVPVGDPIDFIITVKNQGEVASGVFTVTDQIPAGMSLVATNGTDWTCEAAVSGVGSINCTFNSSLNVDEVTILTVTTQIDDASHAPYQNWAEISADSAQDLGLTDSDSTPDTNTGEDFGPGDNSVIAPNDFVNNTNDIDYDGDDDEDDNDFETVDVQLGPPNVSIDLQNGVYAGQNGGDDCPGRVSAAAAPGSEITYCFVVTNTGETYLHEIALNDNALSITQVQMDLISGSQPLAPGESLIFIYETTLDNALINTTIVTGNPTDEEGNDIPDLVNPSAQDSTEVQLFENANPAISIETSIYAGHEAGASCPGDELLTGSANDLITYCFVITNVGDTYLDEITLIDEELGITRADVTMLSGTEPLSPTESIVFYYETTLVDDLLNIASTDGNPVDANGNDLPALANPTAEDSAEAQVPTPDLRLEKTVYLGHDGGQTCPGRELVTDAVGAEITYCFTINNSGDTYLDTIVLTDTALSIVRSDLTVITGTEPLAPNASLVFAYETTLDADLLNYAEASGNPTTADGSDIPEMDNPADNDTAEVRMLPQLATIQLEKSVYLGHNSGQGCAGEELVNGSVGSAITYCFLVTNTGETYLSDVVINDDDLAITDADMTLLAGTSFLAPGASISYFFETILSENTINTADVSANPTDEFGVDLADLDDPTDEDDAEVRTNLASIGDIVWLDSDADGVQDSTEVGLPGISVTLYDENDAVVAGTTSDEQGQFVFNNVEPGNYSLGFALPSTSYAFSPSDAAAEPDDTDSDVDPITGRTPPTLLTTGEVDLSWDAGIYGLPEFAISKVAEQSVVQPGGKLVYKINYTNVGIGQANNVVITENIPLYTRFVPEESSAFVCANGSVEGGTVCTYAVNMIPAQSSNMVELVFVVVAETVIPEDVRIIENFVSIDDGGPAGLKVDGETVQITRPTAGEVVEEPGESFETTLYLPMIQ